MVISVGFGSAWCLAALPEQVSGRDHEDAATNT